MIVMLPLERVWSGVSLDSSQDFKRALNDMCFDLYFSQVDFLNFSKTSLQKQLLFTV